MTPALESVNAAVPDAQLDLLELDPSTLAQVRTAAAQVLERYERIHLLITNAGLILGDRRVTENGYEQTFGVNHLGHFLFTGRLLDRPKAMFL